MKKTNVLAGLLLAAGTAHAAIQHATGEVSESETDFADAAAHPLELTRSYRSQGDASCELGPNWSHSWCTVLQKSDTEATVRLGNGSSMHFRRAGAADPWLADNRLDALIETAGATLYIQGGPEVRYTFNVAGKVQTMAQRNGWAHLFTYDAQGRLASVTNAFGRALQFTYDAAGRLSTAVAPDGSVASYSYDAVGRLSRAQHADGTSRRYSYEDRLYRIAGLPPCAPDQQPLAPYSGGGWQNVCMVPQTSALAACSVWLEYSNAEYYAPSTGGMTMQYISPFDSWTQYGQCKRGSANGNSKSTEPIVAAGSGGLVGVFDEADVRLSAYAYDAAGRAISWQGAAGAGTLQVAYGGGGSSGTLIAGTAVDPAIYRATAQVTDALGQPQTYVLQGGDGQVRLVGASGIAGGNQVANRSFGPLNLPESEADFLGVQSMFTWDTTRQLKIVTTAAAGRPEAQMVQTQWHPIFRLPVLVTEAGRTTAYTYDDKGNKLTEVVTDTATGQNRAWAWTYNAQGLAATMTDPKGGVWTYSYDSAGNRTVSKDPLGRETTYTYDGAGRVLTQTDPGGLVTSYTYDARGRLLTQVRGGEATSYTYTPTGQVASAALPNGYQVSYTYDAAQRLTGAQDNRNSYITYTLDAAGNRIREEVKDSGGNIALATSRVINTLNQVAALQGSVGQTTALGYDANGELIQQTDPLNQTTRQTRDGLRRPTATTFADNASASQAWNQLDQLTQVTDPKGVATVYTYNAFGEVTSETSPDIGTIQYTRDAGGDVVSTTDAKGQIAGITRDALGRITAIQYAPDHLVTYTYNAAGHVTQVEDKSGSTSYERDSQGRILSKTQAVNDNPTSPSLFKLTYGLNAGQITSISYPSGLKVYYRRDTSGRVTGVDTQVKSNKPVTPFVTGLSYTALGQPKAWSWSNGDTAARSFDTDGRMTANEFASYIYDAAGRITGITQSLWAERTVTATVGTATGVVTELYTTNISWSAGYDTRNRITSFVRDGAETRYTYDANSNRLTAIDKTTSDTDLDGEFDSTDFAKSVSQALNIQGNSNRLLGFTQTTTTTNNGKTRSVVTTPVNYAIDANGSLTSDGLRTFDYDSSGRLAKVKIYKDGEEASVRYLVNGMGQRVFKGEPAAEQTLPNEQTLGLDFVTWLKKQFGWLFATAAANTSVGTAYIYGDNDVPSWAMLGEYDNGSASGKGRTEYIWLPTEDGQAIPIGFYRNGNFFAVHTDHLGTPRLVTNENKRPVWQWPYSAFGNNKPSGVLKATPNPKAAITNKPVLLKATAPTEMNLRFLGQYYDDETGTAQNFFRDYDPGQGRYREADPIGLAGGLSRFLYAQSNPLGLSDPEGLDPPKSPTFRCIVCGAPHGGLFGPYCPSCAQKSNDPKSGIPPIWKPTLPPNSCS